MIFRQTYYYSIDLTNLPFVTVCELHIHAVSADKCPTVQRNLDVGWMRDGFTDQTETGQAGVLPQASQLRRTGVWCQHVTRAFDDLQGKTQNKSNLLFGSQN